MFTDRVRYVYLSGPMLGLKNSDAKSWRDKAKDDFDPGIITLDPMRGKEDIPNDEVLSESYNQGLITNQRAIYSRDKYDVVVLADALLVNLLQGKDRVSIGTMFEMAWADGAPKHIPIVTVMQNKGNIHDHPFVREVSAWIVDNMKDAIYILNTILLP